MPHPPRVAFDDVVLALCCWIVVVMLILGI
jgi:hypothetical protein